MPIFWLFVELFDGKNQNKLILKIFYIIISSWLVALISQGDISASIQTAYKRFFTYPISGLLAYFIYRRSFYRKLR